eukprot:Gb_11205 [translate_table: standard]
MRRSSRVASSSCKPILLSRSSLQATVVSSITAVLNKPKRKLMGIVFFSAGKRLTIVSTSILCSCSIAAAEFIFGRVDASHPICFLLSPFKEC